MLPAVGTYVREIHGEQIGTVQAHREQRLVVAWTGGQTSLVAREAVRCGLPIGQTVRDQPRSLRESLGMGRILQLRQLGGREQALVEFAERAECLWLPWENLIPAWTAEGLFQQGIQPYPAYAERFRLRQLALALQHWHATTGALAQVDIDPLPHQYHLVQRILSSGNLNWLIADDVGLGKTIEVGLLLSALRQRGLRRFLLVVPAGLTRQWQTELRTRFGVDRAVIYGRDFEISDPAQWPLYDVVIGSVDRFKHERHLELLKQSGPWDMVIFDEAHRLSRTLDGLSYRSSERYHLAATLRGLTQNVLLLSGTPHQGDLPRFEALLELLRPGPEWKAKIARLRLEPELLSGLVVRNRKADVTDANGEFIFKGKVTHTVTAQQSEAEDLFERRLLQYLQQGYESSRRGGKRNLAIGFVMTIYRKLAASSVAAIETALQRRLQRLQSGDTTEPAWPPEEEDGPFLEFEENLSGTGTEFFAGEISMLEDLLGQARALRGQDTKLQAFTETLLGSILRGNPQERVLMFTEYRTTQEYLVETLERLAPGRVEVIHGGQSQEERAAAIERFEDTGQFLVSTEAGGEGFNLQRRCHIMVNYDLPWNPMRLVQRVGRLYRYGQQKPVIVFNLNTQGSLDDAILQQMYGRLEAVAADMAGVSDEYREGLQEDIVGELASFLDVEDILAEAASYAPERTQQRIEEALERARQAAKQQEELLRFSSGFDPATQRGELTLSAEHLMAFAEGMFAQLGVTVSRKLHKGQVWEIKLSEALQQRLTLNQNQRLAFDRQVAAKHQVLLLDSHSPLLRALFHEAESYEFGGQIAQTSLPGDGVVCSHLRWQDDQGRLLTDSFVALQMAEGQVEVNPPAFGRWLLQPASPQEGEPQLKPVAWPIFEKELQQLLSKGASEELYPAGYIVTGIAWKALE